MVFHHTNFVTETNTWWIRRIRPLWMIPVTFIIAGIGYRYYAWQKIQSTILFFTPEKIQQERAQLNKRQYGYNSYYQPTLERSRKKLMMEAQGKAYRHAQPFYEMYMGERDGATMQSIIDEENAYQ